MGYTLRHLTDIGTATPNAEINILPYRFMWKKLHCLKLQKAYNYFNNNVTIFLTTIEPHYPLYMNFPPYNPLFAL